MIEKLKGVGIFEAKTHFPGICDEVVSSGNPVTVSRRGKPLVVISPVPPEADSEREDIISAMERWRADAGESDDDFPDVWEERSSNAENPLLDAR
ncbi:MAG: prevent-host-death family protein [Akkermansiaceae bacterium]